MSKKYDLIGQRFGKLEVIENMGSDPNSKKKKIKWKCICDCGKDTYVTTTDLVSGKTSQCWDCAHLATGRAKRKSRIGERIGHLVIIDEEYGIKQNGKYSKKYTYQCDCGKIITKGACIPKSEFASCGCAKKDIVRRSCGREIDGQKFGRLTVLETYWDTTPPTVRCICDCGNEVIRRKNDVQSGQTQSCGCYQREQAEKYNTEYHYGYISPYGVKLIDQARKNEKGQWLWTCECSCGKRFEDLPARIKNGHVRSCGCLRSSSNEELIARILEKNNISYEREYTFDDCKSNKNYYLRFDFAIHKPDNSLLLIEENGQQHYNPVSIFGGEEGFKDTVERDNIKKEYCKKNNIQLLELPYYLTPEEVETTIINTIYA